MRHRLFTAILLAAVALRVVTMAGYPVPWLYNGDSYVYLSVAEHPQPLWGFQPSGYPMLLWLLRPFHSLALVAAVQHALGVGTGLLIYAVLRRRVASWAAALATVPVLLDAAYLQLEHSVLSDAMFIFLVVAAASALMWSAELSTGRAALAGSLLAMAALTRTIALPLLVLVVLYLLARRVSRRRIGALAVAGGLPLVLYASWYAHVHDRFTLAGGDGIALWARTMTFADCSKIKPPPAEAPLCPNGHEQDAASEYVWDTDSPINQMPGGFANNNLARSFALHAIAAQPLDYLQAVAADTSLAFAWTPIPHPERVKPAFGFVSGRWTPPEQAQPAVLRYDPGAHAVYSVEPYADFLHAYQYPAHLRGPLLAALFLLGALGMRRGSLLPLGGAVFLLLTPVAVLDFDHRYVLPAVPLACMAAAIGLTAISNRTATAVRAAKRATCHDPHNSSATTRSGQSDLHRSAPLG